MRETRSSEASSKSVTSPRTMLSGLETIRRRSVFTAKSCASIRTTRWLTISSCRRGAAGFPTFWPRVEGGSTGDGGSQCLVAGAGMASF